MLKQKGIADDKAQSREFFDKILLVNSQKTEEGK